MDLAGGSRSQYQRANLSYEALMSRLIGRVITTHTLPPPPHKEA